MRLPRSLRRSLCTVPLLLLFIFGTAPAVAQACSDAQAAPSGAPSSNTNPFQDPSKQPAKLPSTGGGGAADQCANDPTCSGGDGASGGFSSPGQATVGTNPILVAGSAPGHGHGSLLMFALPAWLNQAGGCGQPALPSGGTGGPAGSPGKGRGAPGVPTPPPCPAAPAPPPLPDPAVVARGIALPWPPLTIQAQPAPIGLDGLPTWFWLEGINGQPITATQRVQLAGLPNAQPGCPSGAGAGEEVAVRAVPVGYTWHFGDTLATSSLTTTAPGVPYPQRDGAILHQYEGTSGGSGHPNGFLVEVAAHFRLQFRTGKGTWQALLDTDRQATLHYPVQEAYPVISAP